MFHLYFPLMKDFKIRQGIRYFTWDAERKERFAVTLVIQQQLNRGYEILIICMSCRIFTPLFTFNARFEPSTWHQDDNEFQVSAISVTWRR